MSTRIAFVALALTVATGVNAAPSLEARFGPRRYRQAGSNGAAREVPVTAREDMLVVRADAGMAPEAIAVLVEDAARKTAPQVAELQPVAARLLRSHGAEGSLVVVDLAGEAPRRALVEVARAVAEEPGVRQVYPALARMKGRAFADEHLIVTAAPGQLERVVQDVVEKTGGALVRKSYVADTALVRVGEAFAFDAVAASAGLSVSGLVSAEPNLYRELQTRATVLDDPLLADQWHLSRQNDDVPGEGQIFADLAWDVTLGDPSVVVAVFDSGIDVDHPDLEAHMLPGFDAAGGADDDDPRPGCTSSFDGAGEAPSCSGAAPYRESHGTSVAGAIAAVGDNGVGVAGVCPRCSIIPVRLIADQAQDALTIAETFEKAIDLGADIINNSWGPGFSLFFPLSTAERAAFRHARENGRDGKGTVIVFAAGNDTSDVSSDAYASDPYVISVAAVTNLDDWAFYSNFGRQVDIAAPSQGLPQDQDGIPEDDFGIVTADVQGEEGYDGTDYNPGFGGTSAASPVTAGVAALVLSVNPALTAEQVRLVLTSTADKIVADKIDWVNLIGEDIETLFAYDENGHSIGFGHGRVNAFAAVNAAGSFGVLGGACDAPGCDFCSAENVCLTRCESQDDCVDGSVCNTQTGACEIPRDLPADFLSPCSADCEFCTPTLDSEFGPVDICTVECASDDDCPDGFDCRLTELGGPSICGVGDKGAGDPADFFNCFAPQIGTSLVVQTEAGRELCGDVCFEDGPGACPFGFTCSLADCECTGGGNFGCFEFTCSADDNPGFDDNDFFFPVCLPNPGFGDVCERDLDCQKGDYCKEGACVLDDREGCDICNTCASDEDCLGRGICIGTRDDGIGECAWSCEDIDGCPGDSVCRTVDGNFGDLRVCLSPSGGSTPADRCDPSYQCKVACRDDVPCGSGQVCEAGACVDAPPPDEELPPGFSGGGCACGTSSTSDVAFLGLLVAGLAGLRRRRQG